MITDAIMRQGSVSGDSGVSDSILLVKSVAPVLTTRPNA